MTDLKALLDVRSGSANALNTNGAFSNWEGELEGTAPQWGVLSGKSAANIAAGWLSFGKKSNLDLNAFLSPIQAVLYRVDWDTGMLAHLAIICQNQESAASFAQLVSLLQNASQQQSPDSTSASASLTSAIFQNVEARQNGPRVDLTVSAPVQVLEQLLRGATG
jgi:hypothetical protein